jgi:nitrate/nitrite-specific signal transduction histidine kinase
MDKIKSFLGQFGNIPLHFQLRRLRWMVFPAVLFLAALHQFVFFWVAEAFPTSWQWWLQVLIYTLTGSIAVWLGITWIADAAARRFEAEDQLRQAYAELEENHTQLLALHNLGERVTAADDQHAILEIAARAPLELTGAHASTVVTFDETQDRLKLDMAWGLSESYLTALRSQLENGIPAGRCQKCNSLKTHVGSDCPLFEGLQPTAMADGIQSLICMPVNHEEERIGIISAYFPTADGPPEDHIRLLNILGGVIATALENLRARAREVETLHAIDRATNSDQFEESKAIEDIAQQVLEITAAGWEAQFGGLFLWNDEFSVWDCAAQIELDASSQRFTLAQAMAQQVYASGESIIETGRQPKENFGVGSLAAIPLSTEGKTLGVIILGSSRQRAINENHIELLNTVAHQIALAIRNAQLYAQLGQMAVLQERHRLSREFHDGLAQTLGFLGFQAERVENLIQTENNAEATAEIHELRQTIRDAYADVREAIDGLRLRVENPDQIVERLSEYAAAFTRQTGIHTTFTPNPEKLVADPTIAIQILRIVQEALTNVRKHAGAKNVDLYLQKQQDSLHLIISDDGSGFPTETQTTQLHHSYGLTTMRERAEGLGGTLTIATSPNKGTHITVQIPIKEPEVV